MSRVTENKPTKRLSANSRINMHLTLWISFMVYFTSTVAQIQLDNTGYEGYAHYVTYDDYDEFVPVADSPMYAPRGYERVWNDDAMYIPELILEDPNPRNGTTASPMSIGPCGYTKKGNVFYSAFPGRSNLIRWKVIHPIINGNCTIRLSNGADESTLTGFDILQPVFDFSYQNQDGSYDYFAGEQGNYYRNFYDSGKFSCGRVEPDTFESITVKFPNMTCDECTLQLIVETTQGNIYQCADIEIINSGMTECIGSCLNEGVCVNGKCVCRSGFVGDKCQNRTQEKRVYTPWFAILLLIILAVFVGIVCYIALKFVSQKERWITKKNDPRKSEHYPDAGLAL